MALTNCSRRSLSPHKKSKRMDSQENDTALAYDSLRSLSPHKKSKRTDSPASGYCSHRSLSPHKKSKRMDASKFEVVLSDEDSFELDMAARIQNAVAAEVKREMSRRGLSSVGSQLGPLKDRVVGVEKRLDLHENALDQVADITGKLQEANRRNESRIEEIMLKIGKLTQFERNHQQRLSKLEEGALGSTSSNNEPTDTSRDKRPKHRCCSFCGKELTVRYLRTHQMKHCKKAAASNIHNFQEENLTEAPI